jgi:hypothetical protein
VAVIDSKVGLEIHLGALAHCAFIALKIAQGIEEFQGDTVMMPEVRVLFI